MNLRAQKNLAARYFGISPKRILINTDDFDRVKNAITRDAIRKLIDEGIIIKKQKKGVSRARARKRHIQRKKGRQRGYGRRKGRKTARMGKKELWVIKVRVQRRFLRELRDKGILDKAVYKELLRKVKGGYFRSKNHIRIYIRDRQLAKTKLSDKESQ